MAKGLNDAMFRAMRRDLRKSVTGAVRVAAVEIMNDLAQAGPAYSGAFSSAWYAVPPGQEPGGPRSKGSIYKYDLRNVPRTRFKNGSYFEIVNGASYAPQALDLEEGVFISQLDVDGEVIEPIKTPTSIGKRTGSRRGNVSAGKGFAVSTAPLDWYVTYTSGGSMTRALEQGVKIGFRDGPFGGGAGSPRGFG